jgi:hypothetical protein
MKGKAVCSGLCPPAVNSQYGSHAPPAVPTRFFLSSRSNCYYKRNSGVEGLLISRLWRAFPAGIPGGGPGGGPSVLRAADVEGGGWGRHEARDARGRAAAPGLTAAGGAVPAHAQWGASTFPCGTTSTPRGGPTAGGTSGSADPPQPGAAPTG